MSWKLLRRLISGRIELSEDVWLRKMGRDEYLVCLNGRSARVQTEMLTGQVDRIIYRTSVRRWEPPHENEVISTGDIDRIIAAVVQEFRSSGKVFEIE
jgi:hypothetical protein